MLYLGLVIGVIAGLALGALLTQAKISDMELKIMSLNRQRRADEENIKT